MATGKQLVKDTDSFLAALTEIAKGDDKREEALILLSENSSWEHMLLPAPYSIAILGQLILISAGRDFSLEKISWKDAGDKSVTQHGASRTFTLKHLKYPKSFRACLVQISNSGWNAFNSAHSNMDQIRLRSELIPNTVKHVVGTLLQASNKEIELTLPKLLKSIESNAIECRNSAEEVRLKFKQVMDEIQEMIEVCCCAQNMYDEEASRNAALIKEYEESEKDYQEQKDQLKKDVDSLSSDIGNARKEFEKAQNSIPGFAELASIVLIYQNQGLFIQPFRPPKLESTHPSPDQDDPLTPKFLYVTEVHKMTKVLEEGRENG